MAGSAPGNPLYRLWEEIGVAKYCPLHYQVDFGRICFPDGKTIHVYSDPHKLQKHLLENYPSEKNAITYFTNALSSMLKIDVPFSYKQGLSAVPGKILTGFSTVMYLPAIIRYGNVTLRELIEKVDELRLKKVLTNLVHFGGIDVPLLTILLPLAYAHRRMAGIPVKGWLSFAQAIERRFFELGGKTVYNARVERLIVENGKACGVVLSDGSQLQADIILSAADGRFSNCILPGELSDEACSRFTVERLSDQPVQVNLGVEDEMPGIDGPVTLIMDEPFIAAGREHARVIFHTKYYDNDSAPKGASAMTVFLDSDYAWWQRISADKERYRTEKKKAAEEVIRAIAAYRPGFEKKVRVIDVSTPLTRERYTGNWMGAMQAFRPSENIIGALFNRGTGYKYQGIEDYYIAGQWAEPWGGITTAVQSGRKAVSAICKDHGKRFTTSIP